MQAENSEPISSRERFQEEQRRINEAKALAKDPALTVTDAEIDELEADAKEDDLEDVDKNMGTEAHAVTRQQHESSKLADSQQTALDKMQAVSRNSKISNEQRAQLQNIVGNRKKISDPVLKHLLTQKAMQEQGFTELKSKVKEINDRVMKELMKASNDLLKTQGAIENMDDQILKYVDDNPDSVL